MNEHDETLPGLWQAYDCALYRGRARRRYTGDAYGLCASLVLW
jgi:hypothetical protein